MFQEIASRMEESIFTPGTPRKHNLLGASAFTLLRKTRIGLAPARISGVGLTKVTKRGK